MSVDGCCDHTNLVPDDEVFEYCTRLPRDVDVLMYGRITYQLMVWETATSSVIPDYVRSWNTCWRAGLRRIPIRHPSAYASDRMPLQSTSRDVPWRQLALTARPSSSVDP